MSCANNDIQQMTWDNLLIKGWFADTPIRVLMGRFFSAFPVADIADFDRLRRVPRGAWQMSGCRRFVAAYLPSLSNALWDGLTQKDALFMLLDSNIDTRLLPIDTVKARAESCARSAAKKEHVGTTIERGAVKDHYEKYSRSGRWGARK